MPHWAARVHDVTYETARTLVLWKGIWQHPFSFVALEILAALDAFRGNGGSQGNSIPAVGATYA
ncbi:MAG: hypothetical protein ABL894_02660 [Hyphomicrobium sp.]